VEQKPVLKKAWKRQVLIDTLEKSENGNRKLNIVQGNI
jgi:hypothetical protein